MANCRTCAEYMKSSWSSYFVLFQFPCRSLNRPLSKRELYPLPRKHNGDGEPWLIDIETYTFKCVNSLLIINFKAFSFVISNSFNFTFFSIFFKQYVSFRAKLVFWKSDFRGTEDDAEWKSLLLVWWWWLTK